MSDTRLEQIDPDNAFTIFKNIGEDRSGFVPGWYDRFTGVAMAESFQAAADLIADNRTQVSPRGDAAFWPVAYLYRHAHELLLKVLLPKASNLAGAELSNNARKVLLSHDLNGLWNRTRRCISEIWTEGNEKSFEKVDSTINDLHAIDPLGDAFRYPTARDGNEHLLDLPFGTSIDHFCNSAAESFNCLSGMLIAVEEYLQVRYEMSAEYSADMRGFGP